jgi:hypothetical protein
MGQLFRHRFLMLLVTLLLLFALYPFLEQEISERLISFFFTAIVIAGMYAVSRKPRFLVLAIVLAIGALSSQWLSHFIDSRLVFGFSRGLGFLFFLLITIAVLTNVLRGETVTTDKVCGAICAYLMMGLVWAYLFGLLEVTHPGSFLENGGLIATRGGTTHQFALLNSMIYYSIATLTTTTYGDILPKSTPARALSNLEAIAGQMYVAVVISRLVALHIMYHFNPRPQTKD